MRRDENIVLIGMPGAGKSTVGAVSYTHLKEYEQYVSRITPTHNLFLQMIKAFVTGGTICLTGQIILNVCAGMGLDLSLIHI